MNDKELNHYRCECDFRIQEIKVRDAKSALERGYEKLKADLEKEYAKLKNDVEREIVMLEYYRATVENARVTMEKGFETP